MKNCIVFFLFAVLAVALGAPEDKYTDKYDHINVVEVLGNRRLLTSYIKCALDEGKCTVEGNELKSHIKEALENQCGKCTDVQKTETRHIIKHLINEEPEFWSQLTVKYDPTKKYVTKYEKELKEIKH